MEAGMYVAAFIYKFPVFCILAGNCIQTTMYVASSWLWLCVGLQLGHSALHRERQQAGPEH